MMDETPVIQNAENEHIHSEWTCFPHVRGCDCDDVENTICNPYFDDDKCPTKDAPYTPNYDCPVTNPTSGLICELHYPGHTTHLGRRMNKSESDAVASMSIVRW